MQLHSTSAQVEIELRRPTSTTDESPYEPLVRSIYRFMYCHVGNREEAEELTARACMRTIRGAHGTMAAVQASAGDFCQTARSVLAEHLQWFSRPSSQELITNESTGPAETLAALHAEAEEGGVSTHTSTILAQLPAREREFLTYRFLRNASLAETAAQMGITPADALALQWHALKHAAQLATNETAPFSPPDDVADITED